MPATHLDCRSVVYSGEIVDAIIAEPRTQERLTSTTQFSSRGLLELLEFILKRRDQLDRLIRESAIQSQLVPRFLAIALCGFLLFGIALSLVFTSATVWPHPAPIPEVLAGRAEAWLDFRPIAPPETWLSRWYDGSAPKLIAAYTLGLVAATGVCLPSLYFYGLLAGVRMTMLDVVTHALKSKATAAVVLVGVLPIYAAIGLGMAIFDLPDVFRHATFLLGLGLPFLTGLFGTYSLYRGFAGFADTLASDRRCRRECFLRRLVLSWSACYTAVTPLMIYTLWVTLETH